MQILLYFFLQDRYAVMERRWEKVRAKRGAGFLDPAQRERRSMG